MNAFILDSFHDFPFRDSGAIKGVNTEAVFLSLHESPDFLDQLLPVRVADVLRKNHVGVVELVRGISPEDVAADSVSTVCNPAEDVPVSDPLEGPFGPRRERLGPVAENPKSADTGRLPEGQFMDDELQKAKLLSISLSNKSSLFINKIKAFLSC